MRLVQHKKEAYWFYRFLSIFYDDFVNPFFWNSRMRDEALQLAELETSGIDVVDVGSGTGFTTQGIVQQVPSRKVTCIDQSPHQMAHAKAKSDLRGCQFLQGDAENLPFVDDQFDRYVSAGSIEYWPDPQKGICESYRVIKPGGIVLMIGPLRPRNAIARFIADAWMLFPEEAEYEKWYENAGFTDIQKKYVAPAWVNKEKYGVAIAGRKPQPGPSPLSAAAVPQEEVAEKMTLWRRLKLAARLVLGSLAGLLFIPIAIWGYFRQLVRNLIRPDEKTVYDPLTPQQLFSFMVLATAGLLIVSWFLL